MSDERKESLFIVKYAGKDTADEVYDVVRDLAKILNLDLNKM